MRVASSYRLKVEPIDFPEWEEVSFRGKSRYEFGMTLSLMGGWSKDHWLSVTVGKEEIVVLFQGPEARELVRYPLTREGYIEACRKAEGLRKEEYERVLRRKG